MTIQESATEITKEWIKAMSYQNATGSWLKEHLNAETVGEFYKKTFAAINDAYKESMNE